MPEILRRDNSRFSVLLGRDGWRYIWEINNIEDKVLGKTFFSDRELEMNGRNSELRAAWCRDRGVEYIHLIGPDKASVYPQFLPEDIVRPKFTLIEQMTEEWGKPSRRIKFVDSLNLLRRKSQEYQVYFKTDSHWNYFGARDVFNAMAEKLIDRFPNFTLVGEDNSETREVSRLFELGSLSDDLPKETVQIIKPNPDPAKLVYESDVARGKTQIFEQETAGLPHCVIFRDSFSSFFLPFITARCSRTVVINSARFWYEVVEHEQADIAIFEVAERFLHPFTPDMQARSFEDVFQTPLVEVLDHGVHFRAKS